MRNPKIASKPRGTLPKINFSFEKYVFSNFSKEKFIFGKVHLGFDAIFGFLGPDAM